MKFLVNNPRSILSYFFNHICSLSWQQQNYFRLISRSSLGSSINEILILSFSRREFHPNFIRSPLENLNSTSILGLPSQNLQLVRRLSLTAYHSTMTTILGNKEIRLPLIPSMPMNEKSAAVEGVSLAGLGPDQDFDRGYHNVVTSCARCLATGGVVAVPTDTIYGVACLAQNTTAVNLLYEIKQRNYKNPVAISVARIDDIYRWSKVTVPRQVLEDLLPGPVTVVFERSPDLNPALNPHTNLVGIRIPGHKFMQDLAKECESPIALTSANISGATSCLRIEEFDSLWPHLNLVVNGGTLSDSQESRLGSTVVDLSVPGTFRIIRPGSAHEPTTSCLREKHHLKEATTESANR